MKKFLFFSFLLFSFAFVGNSVVSAQEKEEPQVPIEVIMERDAQKNLNIAWQYFKLKKAYLATLSRAEETIDAFPAFSKMDEVFYLAGMSSFYLSENKGRQKIDEVILTEAEKEKYDPQRLRENAVAYLSKVVEEFPESKYKDDAQDALEKLKKK